MKNNVHFFKKIGTTLALAALMLAPVWGWGQSLLVDDFTGLNIANLAGQSSWTKGGSGPDATVANTTPLIYTGYNGGGGEYVVMPTGTSTASKVYKALVSTPAPGTNTFYYSLLLRLTSTTATGDYCITLGDPTTGTVYFARLFAKTSGSGFAIGGSKLANVATANFGSTVFNYNTTYLIVVRYTCVSSGSNDLMYVWVNPDITSEPTTVSAEVTITASLGDATPAAVGNFHWHNRTANNPVGSFDGVRVAYGSTSALAWSALDASLAGVSAPTNQASNITFNNIAQTQMDVSWTIGNGAKRVVKMNTSNSFTTPVDGTDPSANAVYGGAGEQVVYNGAGSTIPTITGLTAGNTYWYRVYEYNGSGSTTMFLNTTATNNPNSQATSSSTTAPLISSPTATAITTTTAVLGGDITSDGGSAIIARGTVWSTSSPVTIGNNILAEGGTSTGVFTQSRTSLPSNTLIYYAAYATNIVGTTLTGEASFTTLKTDPSNHVTGFAAGTPTATSIPLSWTDATGTVIPDGYLILYNTTGTFMDPIEGTSQINGAGIQNVAQGVQTYTVNGLTGSTLYYFKIWPYTNSGTDINYKTDGTVPTANATTLTSPTATVTLRPSYIDLSATTSENAVLMTLSNYSSDDARYRLYATNQYWCWDEATDAYITSSSYGSGPQVPGTPSTSTTFWILFQRGTNATVGASYRDRLGTAYSSNYQTVALPAATSITTPFTLSGTFIGSESYTTAVKHVVLAYSGATLVSAASTSLTTGGFAVVCPDGTTIDKIEIRAVDNTLIETKTGSWTVTTDLGSIGTSTFTGIGNWSAGNWSNGIPTATINAIIKGNVTVDDVFDCKNMTISSSGAVTVGTGQGLSVNGNFLIESDATGTGSFIGRTADYDITGTQSVQRYITGAAEAWHLLSSPVANQAISGDFTPSGSYGDGTGYDFYAWNEPTVTWLNQKVGANNINSFVPGKGYLVAYQALNPTKTFAGVLNEGIYSFPVTATVTGGYGQSNLAGNPYPSSIDWKNVPGLDKSDLFGYGTTGVSLYIYNQAFSNYGVYNDANVGDAGTNGASRYIAPMQGFFVLAANAGDFLIDNDARVHNTQAWLKSGNENEFRLRVNAPTAYGADELLLDFAHATSVGGADKWNSLVPTAPGIYTPKEGRNYSISFLTSVSENPMVPVAFTAGIDGNYNLTADFNSAMFSSITLKDTKTSATQDLKVNPVYNFSATTGDDVNRFTLHFTTVGIDNPSTADAVLVYAHDGLVYLNGAPANATINILDITGRVVQQSKTNGSSLTTLNVSSLLHGVYVVNIISGKQLLSRKIIL